MTDSTLPIMPYNNDDDASKSNDTEAKRTSPGGQKEVRWKVVAETPGLMPAQIIAGRLHEEGIPVRAWQEGAGQALGLTVGLLGTGYVAVPEEYEEKALEILAIDFDDSDDWQDEDE
jgi:hypothetical protein